jgi:hypothetical protein
MFYENYLAMRNTADLTDGKLIRRLIEVYLRCECSIVGWIVNKTIH